MLSKLVMLMAQAAVSSTCGEMPGHWSPNIAPALTPQQVVRAIHQRLLILIMPYLHPLSSLISGRIYRHSPLQRRCRVQASLN